MKKLLNLALLIFTFTMVYGQQAPQYSFNMFNHMAVNPGFAGANGGVCLKGIYHNQWMGADFADGGGVTPTTMVFSGDMALKNINSGVGLNLVSDAYGYAGVLYMNANYAYRLKVGDDGDLGIGIGVGFIQNSLSGDWITPGMLNDPNGAPTDDNLVPMDESKLAFDANIGAFYHGSIDKYNEMYAGVSITNITSPSLETSTGFKALNFPRSYYFTGGYYYTLPNGLIQLRPSVFVKTDFKAAQTSINLTGMYNQMMWAGLTYRFSGDIAIIAGATLKNNITFGISYDFTSLGNDLASMGSLGVMLKYCFSLSGSKGRTSYKSVRFL